MLEWDISVHSERYSADANIKTNVTQIQVLGQLWNSDTLLDVFNNLSLNTTSSNSGNLVGNRVFYANDYAVRMQLHPSVDP